MIVLCAGATSFDVAPARASNFQVDPTRVTMDRGRTEMFSIINRGDTEVRFQVQVKAWSQSPEGGMVLEDTEDLVAYPSLLTLGAGERRSIRVGLTGRRGAIEASYRVFVQELPALQRDATAGPRVTVLTRMGIPVFVPPKQQTRAGHLEKPALADGQLRFRIANAGTVHTRIGDVRVVGRDGDDQVILDRTLRGWYVLAGVRRPFELKLDPDTCAALVGVQIAAEHEGGVWSNNFEVSDGGCGAAL